MATREQFGTAAGLPVEERIARVAADQHGVITRRQLLEAGLTPRMVSRRVAARRLRRLHKGVYLVGPLVDRLMPPRAREMAAVLACGPGALASHRSAAWLLSCVRRVEGPVDVTTPGRKVGSRPGIRAHWVSELAAAELAVVDGIPCTAPARTLLDLARVATSRELEQALGLAERQGLVSREALWSLTERHRGGRGTRMLRALLRGPVDPAFTRSEAEDRFLSLVRESRLPAPQVNVRVGGHELDFFWEAEGLAVEVDGFAFHSSRARFENDRRRDAELEARGIQVIRVTWRQLADEPIATMVRVAQALALRRSASR